MGTAGYLRNGFEPGGEVTGWPRVGGGVCGTNVGGGGGGGTVERVWCASRKTGFRVPREGGGSGRGKAVVTGGGAGGGGVGRGVLKAEATGAPAVG